MEHILHALRESLEDEFLSKAERRNLKTLIGDSPLTAQELSVLRSKMYELAQERINDKNYKFIMEWVKNVNNTLISQPDSSTADAYFSPGDACRSIITSQINTASQNLRICVFTISDDVITNSIATAHKKGVTVQIITDNDKLHDEGSDINYLSALGIPIKTDTTPNHMHHKFMVVDDRALLTGSYNWTRSAALYNHENVLFTTEGRVIRSYLKEFSQLWKVMVDF
jgi:mitochondrial cardiolipin hydrolase